MTVTVLVIDDSEDDQHLYRRALKECDCRLVMASSAKAGLLCMADQRPGVILLDYNLPDLSGLDFIRMLGFSGTPPPIIMLTGEGSESVAVEVMKSGADDYLVKDTAGQYLRLLPGVIARAVASYAQREQNQRLQQETAMLLRRNQTLMQNSVDGIHVMDIEGNIVEANDAFCRMLGYTQEEVTRLNVADWDDQWTAEELREQFRAFTGKSGLFETVHRRKDGTLINVEISTSHVEMEGQHLFFALSRDITARKQAEAVLRQHKLVLDTSIDGFWMADIKGNLLEANEAYAKISGYQVEELVNMHISQLEAIELTPEEVQAHIAKVIAQGGYDRFETRHRHKDGHEIDIEVSVTYMAEPQRLFVFCRDITKRKKVERELNASESRWRSITQNSPDHIIMTDREGIIQFINHTVPGLTPGQVIGTPIFAYMSDKFKSIVRATFQRVLNSGQPDRYETEYCDAEGNISYFESNVGPVQDQDQIAALIISARDITSRKKAEEALLNGEANLRAMLDNSPYLTWLKDTEGRYITINKVFADYLRLEDARQIIGKTDLDLQPKELAEKYRADDAEVMAARQQKHAEEEAFDGSQRHWVETYKTPIIDTHGNVLGTVGFANDITERKRTEQALLDMNKRKDAFLAMLAHELRNPLAPIRNAAHVLGKLELAEPRVQWAQKIIEEQVTHLSRMVDDLLDVSRIARNKVTLKMEIIELATLVDRVIESARPLAERKGHRLTVRLPAQPVQLEGDPVRMFQVLFNLIENATKYTPDGGQIELAARMAGQEIEISVRDNGMGITAELLPHVFDLFQQDERTLDRAQGGLGIGLTLVQRLVEKHGGRVKAYSEGQGLGSVFTIWLQAKAISAQPATHEARDKSFPKTSMRLLVVDDDHNVADSTAVMLELEGHEVRTAYTGQAALELVPIFRPQVVLLDIGLKGMDGFRTAQRLRELPEGRDLRVVAMTGYGDEKTKTRALASGCDHLLVKPVAYDAISALLAQCCRTE